MTGSMHWDKEPDLTALRHATSLLVSDPSGAIKELTDLASRRSPVAMYVLGETYQRGAVVERDWLRAKEWYNLAMELGNPRAAYALGWMEDSEKNFDRAHDFFLIAAEAGFAPAMNALALSYFFGRNGTENRKTARSWWANAQKSGTGPSKITFGSYLLKGRFGFIGIFRGLFMILTALLEGPLIYSENKFDDRLK